VTVGLERSFQVELRCISRNVVDADGIHTVIWLNVQSKVWRKDKREN
jgi:hypothetical protein